MIDIQNDPSLEFFGKIVNGSISGDAKSLLKEASVDYDFDDLVKEAFADQENRRFPIFSPEMAVISAVYMQHQDVDPLVKEACENALNEWGIEGVSCDRLEKTASFDEIPEDAFLLKEAQKFPVLDEETLEKSAYAVKSMLGKLGMPERVEACTNLYKKAVYEYGVDPVDLGAEVVSYAQEAPCSITKLAMAVNERHAETGYDGYEEFLEKIAKFANMEKSNYIFDKSVNSGIAIDLFALDKEAGVIDKFDAIKDVFNSPFYVNDEGELEKSASVSTVVIGEYYIPEDALEKVARDEFASEFPGFDEEVFDGDSINPDRLVQATEHLLPDSKNTIGEFLSQYAG